jgi:hypothetical protein
MDELFPVLGGILLGLFLGCLPNKARWWGAMPAALIGLAATMLSGEFRLSWAFLLVDIPLAGIGCAAGLLLVQKIRWANPAKH